MPPKERPHMWWHKRYSNGLYYALDCAMAVGAAYAVPVADGFRHSKNSSIAPEGSTNALRAAYGLTYGCLVTLHGCAAAGAPPPPEAVCIETKFFVVQGSPVTLSRFASRMLSSSTALPCLSAFCFCICHLHFFSCLACRLPRPHEH